MAKIILIFASMSGNTEMMAQAIAKGVKEMGEQIEVIDVFSEGLKIELTPDVKEIEECRTFGKKFVTFLKAPST